MSRKATPVPTILRIDRGPTSEKLYKAEEDRAKVVGRTAEELAKFLIAQHFLPDDFKIKGANGAYSRDFDREVLPQSLANVLEGYERHSSIAACIAYLRQPGRFGARQVLAVVGKDELDALIADCRATGDANLINRAQAVAMQAEAQQYPFKEESSQT